MDEFALPSAGVVQLARLLVRPPDAFPFERSAECARLASAALPLAAGLARRPPAASAPLRECLAGWVRARAWAAVRRRDGALPLWLCSWFIVECLLRAALLPNNAPQAPSTVRAACFGPDAGAALDGFARFVAFGTDEEDDWVEGGRPSLAALRAGERLSALAAASAEAARFLREHAAPLPFEDDEEEARRVLDWLRAWAGADLAEAHRERLAERFVAVTPLDLHAPAVADAPERDGAEARLRPRAFALSVSRPDVAGAAVAWAREATKRAFEDPALEEAAGLATLAYAVQQACQVELDGAFVFWDDRPLETVAHLQRLSAERGATRRVPRLVRSGGAWHLVVGGTQVPQTFEMDSWASAVGAWCRRVRDEADGMLGRGRNASNAVQSILRPPRAVVVDARAALGGVRSAPLDVS